MLELKLCRRRDHQHSFSIPSNSTLVVDPSTLRSGLKCYQSVRPAASGWTFGDEMEWKQYEDRTGFSLRNPLCWRGQKHVTLRPLWTWALGIFFFFFGGGGRIDGNNNNIILILLGVMMRQDAIPVTSASVPDSRSTLTKTVKRDVGRICQSLFTYNPSRPGINDTFNVGNNQWRHFIVKHESLVTARMKFLLFLSC